MAQSIKTKASLALKATHDPTIKPREDLADDEDDKEYFKQLSNDFENLAPMDKSFQT